MDISKEYILMCEKVGEIQEVWEPAFGDFIVSAEHCIRRKNSSRNLLVVIQYARKDFSNPKSPMLIYAKSPMLIYAKSPNQMGDNKYKEDKVWLPRQDQLQKILSPDCNDKDICWLIGCTVEMGKMKDPYKFTSMEQLWLAFVMKEKYSKRWDKDKEEWKD